MKVNKKAILGMLVAMVMSLGMIGGINTKQNDSNLMNLSALVWSQKKYAENQFDADIISGMAVFTGGVGIEVGFGGAVALAACVSNPAGWVALGVGALYVG